MAAMFLDTTGIRKAQVTGSILSPQESSVGPLSPPDPQSQRESRLVSVQRYGRCVALEYWGWGGANMPTFANFMPYATIKLLHAFWLPLLAFPKWGASSSCHVWEWEWDRLLQSSAKYANFFKEYKDFRLSWSPSSSCINMFANIHALFLCCLSWALPIGQCSLYLEEEEECRDWERWLMQRHRKSWGGDVSRDIPDINGYKRQ